MNANVDLPSIDVPRLDVRPARLAWGVIVAGALLDVATTTVGLEAVGVIESNGHVLEIVGSGVVGMLFAKAVYLYVVGLLSLVVGRWERLALLATTAAIQALVAGWNVRVLLAGGVL